MSVVNRGLNMDRYIQGFFDEFGEPSFSREVKQSHIEFYRGKLPDKLLEFWQQFGFCGFKKGLFWIVDPSEYESILDSWIGDTKVVETDSYFVFARNGFGDLYLWGTNTGYKLKIKPNIGWIIEQDGTEEEIRKGDSNFPMQRFLAMQDFQRSDLKDVNTKKLLFNNAVKKFSALKENEVFGFEPALFLGGKQTLDNLNKLDIQTHLSILADFGHREFIDDDELARRAFGD